MSRVDFIKGICDVNGLGVHQDKFIELLGFLWVISSKIFFAKGMLDEWFYNVWRWYGFVAGQE